MEFDLKRGAEFFDFFGRHGVDWFMVEAQVRKVDGKRGAPLGQFFGQKFATHFKNCPVAFKKLSDKLARAGKTKIDLQTRESPARAGGRLVLIDDLQAHSVKELMTWWAGPIVVLETSPMNFQSILVSPTPLLIQKQFKVQKLLAEKFAGDLGATGPGQLHRLPGSLNWKKSAIVDGRPFCCRTVTFRPPEDGQADQLDELLSLSGSAHKPPQPRPAPARAGGVAEGKNNSVRAFRWTVNQIKRGADPESILIALSTVFLAHHDPDDWPKRTLHNSRFFLGLTGKRYSARS